LNPLRRNLIANFLGQGWSGLMSVAFVPVYIALLGIEAYGLIGLYVSLQALFFILDAGMSSTLNRVLAGHAHRSEGTRQARELARTLEWIYWPMGLLIFALVFAGSGPVAAYWLHPVGFTTPEVTHALVLMGLALALQWPSTLYSGGFRGLERQVALNSALAGFVTLRNVGAVAVLWFWSPTITAFLWWQVAVGAMQSLTLAFGFWRVLPGDEVPRFRRTRLAEVAHFSAGMAAISAVSFLLAYSDRIILSRVLPLDQFGYYALAATAAAVLAPIVQSFFNAVFPRFSNLVAAAREAEVSALYHGATQWLTVCVAPAAAVLSLFAVDALRLWSGNVVLAETSGPILALLVIGVALNGLATVPYALQIANGWTRLTLVQNSIALLAMLPALCWLAPRFGGLGVAAAWIALNFAYLAIGVPLMHRRLLRGQFPAWLLRDVLPPAAAASGVALLARLAAPTIPRSAAGAATLAAIGACSLLAAAVCAPAARAALRRSLRR
jgi:O-antigen/teichoic acid export membrane protein